MALSDKIFAFKLASIVSALTIVTACTCPSQNDGKLAQFPIVTTRIAKLEAPTKDAINTFVGESFGFTEKIKGIRPVAWCCKIEEPNNDWSDMIEELIVIVDWGGANDQSTLISICRHRPSDYLENATFLKKWRPNSHRDCIQWKQEIEGEVNGRDCAEFIRRTNFGPNEIFNHIRPVEVQLFLFPGDPTLREVVQNGIGSAEKLKRYYEFMDAHGKRNNSQGHD